MSAPYSIRIEHVGKRYRLGAVEPYKTLRDAIMRPFTQRRGEAAAPKDIWALDDVSFDVREGEVVGIIGRNGAGKSTLLKLLTRITRPDRGRITHKGRIAALLEVGTGFHPELTGRENIFLNGAILGMSRADIERRFDEIVDFSGVETFLDTPVKRYSSGMRVRLGFAVAAHLEPEILVVDEVLAVGDAEFQRKCLGRMNDVAAEGRTVLFVSHQMEAIQSLCSRAVWLHGGKLMKDGPAGDVVGHYLAQTLRVGADTHIASREDRTGDGALRCCALQIDDGSGLPPRTGGTIAFGLELRGTETFKPIGSVGVRIAIRDDMDRIVTMLGNDEAGVEILAAGPTLSVTCTNDRLPLVPGQYVVDIAVRTGSILHDKIFRAATFQVMPGPYFVSSRQEQVGVFHMDQAWIASSRREVAA